MPDHTRPAQPPDADTLTNGQLQGTHCARCNRRLERTVRIGTVHTRSGDTYDLWSCPACATLDELAAQQQADKGVTAGYCLVCDQWAADAVVAVRVPSISGSGYLRYAHSECARRAGYKPATLEP